MQHTITATINHGSRSAPSYATYSWVIEADFSNPLILSMIRKGFQETLTDANSTCKGVTEPATPEERKAAVEKRLAKILDGTYVQGSKTGRTGTDAETKALSYVLTQLGFKGKLDQTEERLLSFARTQVLSAIQAQDMNTWKTLMKPENADQLAEIVSENLEDCKALITESEGFKEELKRLTEPKAKPTAVIGNLQIKLK